MNLIDLSSVELKQEMQFDYCENILSMLSDKAISVCRSRVVQTYLINKQPSREESRLLLFYLFAGDKAGHHVEYLKKYARDDFELDMLLDYLVIRVIPKEKELKVDFRGFGCKTWESRLQGVTQERNAMRYHDVYGDEQALTLTELELTKKIYSLLRLKELYKDHSIFYITFDASGWNNKFRDETVRPVAQATIDKVMGVKVFSFTQSGYEHSFIYIPDAKYLIWWNRQYGGIEGLNQATWQLVYMGQIKTAFEGTNLTNKTIKNLNSIVLYLLHAHLYFMKWYKMSRKMFMKSKTLTRILLKVSSNLFILVS